MRRIFQPYLLDRTSFAIRFSLFFVFLFFSFATVYVLLAFIHKILAILVSSAWIFAMILYFYFFILAPRLRQTGLPGIYAILLLLPIINLLILCVAFFFPRDSCKHWRVP